MKTMTCKQLGGACDKEFQAESFEKMAALSKQHGMDMASQADADHLAAMEKMQDIMKDPKAMVEWYRTVQKEFEALPDDD